MDSSNYVTKADLKSTTGIDISKLAPKSDLVSLKAEVEKLDIDKLKNVPTNFSNLKSRCRCERKKLIKELFGILIIVNVIMINYVMLKSI